MPTSLGVMRAPKMMAVVGASRREGTIGRQIVHHLLSYGFTGAVYPVNPRAPSICGVRAYPSVADIPDPIDVATIVVPIEQVLDVAEQCGAAGVKGMSVISAGFREVWPEGAAHEQKNWSRSSADTVCARRR